MTQLERARSQAVRRETMVPVLPCTDVDETLALFEMLGFEITYRMTKPYLYLAFQRGGIEVHYGEGLSTLDPGEERSGGCLVMVDEVAPYHRDFTAAMRRRHGRVLAKGRPRITRLRPGQTRFSIVDPSGNNLIFIERDEPSLEYGGTHELEGLAKANDNARIFREFKNDDAGAAKILDTALKRHWERASVLDRVRALAARAELAIALDDRRRASELQAQIRGIPLTPAQCDELAGDLDALAQLDAWLAQES